MDPLTITQDVAAGNGDQATVKLIQEWLNLHDERIGIDGDFGPATEAAVISFQASNGLPQTGVVDAATFEALERPLAYAIAPSLEMSEPLAGATLKIALRHASQFPREVGGQNRGPWVRLYMDGHEGANWPWCAGFATTCMRQAAQEMQIATPFKKSYSCDIIGTWAVNNNRLVRGTDDLSAVQPGHLFLVRRTDTDWKHIGIVQQINGAYCTTVEGNTNNDHSSEGYAVFEHTRAVAKLDFVVY